MADASQKLRSLELAHAQIMQQASMGFENFTPEAVTTVASTYADFLDGKTERQEQERRSTYHTAHIVHEAVRAYHIASGEPNPAPEWHDCDKSLRDSVMIGIRRVIENPNITDEMLHDSWIETRTEQGWTYGPVRSDEDKTHPCLVPYEQLTAFQRTKDALFSAIVRTSLGIERYEV